MQTRSKRADGVNAARKRERMVRGGGGTRKLGVIKSHDVKGHCGAAAAVCWIKRENNL